MDNTNHLSSQHSKLSSVAKWQQIAFWSVLPTIIVVPIWVALGRAFFGAGGWYAFITLPAAAIIFFPFHLLLMALAFFTKQRYLSRRVSLSLYAYYALIIINQLSLVDGGDTSESVGSAFSFMGMSQETSTILFMTSGAGVIVTMILLIIFLIIEIISHRRLVSAKNNA